MAEKESRVEVGCLEKPENPWLLESRFFPSKVGGKPAWLDLKNISVDITCRVCLKPCAFLCQVYAPIANQDNAYHRTVYVFVCKNPECNKSKKSDNFIVFRCQLPQINDFYVPEEPNDEPEWHPESKIENFTQTCSVCGCSGTYHCGKCKSVRYCSKEHQIMDWKTGHNKLCQNGGTITQTSNFLFPEYEMIIEEEFYDEEVQGEKEVKTEKSEEDALKEFHELVKCGKAGTLKDISPEVLENYAFSNEDKYLKNFKKKLQFCPDQVLRYDKGGVPLWVAEPDLMANDIPRCDYCDSPRQFEFQVLPTMLSYLDVDDLGASLDWGTLLVYTCKNNCDLGPAYKNEFLHKQDIV